MDRSNGNYVVDCDLLNAAVQDLRATGGDLCGQGDANYGKNRSSTALDPSILNGWDARPNDWQFGVSVQQEVMPRVSVEVGYYRRWWPIYDGVDVTDNIAVASSEFGQFSVVAPTDSRLPNGGSYTINGLYNIRRPRRRAPRTTCARQPTPYGEHDRHRDGFDTTFRRGCGMATNIRAGPALDVSRRTSATCVRTRRRAWGCPIRRPGHLIRACSIPTASRWAVLDHLQGERQLPGAENRRQVSGTFSSRPGAILRADAIYQANDPTILATLGRPLAAAAANVTVPLIGPYEAYGDRIDQVDMRIGKILRFGRTRSNISLDVVNLFNSNDNIAYQTLLSPTWPAPTQVLLPRIFRVNFGIDW